jgi:hypothetical protein
MPNADMPDADMPDAICVMLRAYMRYAAWQKIRQMSWTGIHKIVLLLLDTIDSIRNRHHIHAIYTIIWLLAILIR